GAIVRLTAQIDDGVMRNCITLARWRQYGHCLSKLVLSKMHLSVASGMKIWPVGHWWGEVTVGGITVMAWFEVFDCGGAFNILLGKPRLHSVRATHNYELDEISIHAHGGSAVLQN
ncbi:hypothetical protein B0H14DRAFT_2232838, partial [Mycena olivaceomarginata]